MRKWLLGIVVGILLGSFVAPGAAFGASRERLSQGSDSYKVVKLQIALDTNKRLDYYHYHGYTGYFGPLTASGLKAWEADNGYKPNGRIKVGSRAWRKLMRQQRPVIDQRCYNYSRVACIDLTTDVLRYMKRGRMVKSIPIRDGMPGLETRQGAFSIYGKDADAWSKLYDVPMPYSLKFSGGQYIHYSAEFSRVGYTSSGSHGCVNISDRSTAAWLYKRMHKDDVVITYRS